MEHEKILGSPDATNVADRSLSSLSGDASVAAKPDPAPRPNLYNVKRGALLVGRVAFRNSPRGGGWQYVPFTDAHNPSRKLWPTPEAAIKGRTKGCTLERAP